MPRDSRSSSSSTGFLDDFSSLLGAVLSGHHTVQKITAIWFIIVHADQEYLIGGRRRRVRLDAIKW